MKTKLKQLKHENKSADGTALVQKCKSAVSPDSINVDVDGIHFHMNSLARRLVLTRRQRATRKSPIILYSLFFLPKLRAARRLENNILISHFYYWDITFLM